MTAQFDPARHIVRIGGEITGAVSDGSGGIFTDIHGLAGAKAVMANGDAVGVDLVKMAAGAAFEIHTHPGAHILVIREGRGGITIDGVRHHLREGDTVFVPAQYAHGVDAAASSGLVFLAFGVPHLPIWSPDRMTLVDDEVAAAASAAGPRG